jgi:hypothetical protein
MRAPLRIEDIGWGRRRNVNAACRLIGEPNAIKCNAWVARVRMSCGRIDREFIKPTFNNSKANAPHTRGVYKYYWLECGDGYVYEVSAPLSWRRVDRYFCVVTIDGEIQRVDEEYVRDYA